jgi:hypothetical protein
MMAFTSDRFMVFLLDQTSEDSVGGSSGTRKSRTYYQYKRMGSTDNRMIFHARRSWRRKTIMVDEHWENKFCLTSEG